MADADVRWLQRLENYERALATLERALSLAATLVATALTPHGRRHSPTAGTLYPNKGLNTK